MRIAFIGQKGIPASSGGVERYVEEVSTRMAAQGHQVVAYVRGHYVPVKKVRHKGVRLLRMPYIKTKHLEAITHTFFSTLHALFCSYDVIHYQSIGPTSLAWVIRLLKPKTRVIATFQCKDYEHQKWGWFARLYLRFGEWITCMVPHEVIVVNQELKRYVKEGYGREVQYIPNGSHAQYTLRQRAIKKWGLTPKNYIIAVSRLVKHKEIHHLIEAFSALEEQGKLPHDMKLVIVGESAYTNAYVQELTALAKASNNIIFTGEQQGEALRELFSHASLFVQPSLAEGLSMALLEAMGYGLVAVVSDIPANQEAIGDCGVTFLAGNVVSLTQSLEKVIHSPQAFSHMGALGRKRVETYFNWNSITQDILEVYQPSSFSFRKSVSI